MCVCYPGWGGFLPARRYATAAHCTTAHKWLPLHLQELQVLLPQLTAIQRVSADSLQIFTQLTNRCQKIHKQME